MQKMTLDIDFIDEKLTPKGWKKLDISKDCGVGSTIVYQRLYDPIIQFDEGSDILLDKSSKIDSPKNWESSQSGGNHPVSAIRGMKKPSKNKGLQGGVKHLYGTGQLTLTPSVTPRLVNQIEKSRFSQFESLRVLRGEMDCLTVGVDTEWYGENPRIPLSYQFSVFEKGKLLELVILNTDSTKRLSLEFCLGVVLTRLGYKSYRWRRYLKQQACVGYDSSGNAKWRYYDGKEVIHDSAIIHPLIVDNSKGYKTVNPHSSTIDVLHDKGVIDKYSPSEAHKDSWLWSRTVPLFPKDSWTKVQLVCHTGKVDLSMFDVPRRDYDGYGNILRYVSEIQGGVMTLTPTRRYPIDVINTSKNKNLEVFPVSLTIRDTMGQAPAGKKSLETLGDMVHFPKLKDDGIDKSDMLATLKRDPALYFDYAARDSSVTLVYFASIYGIDKLGAITLTGGSAKVMKESMKNYMNVESTDDFDREYRGLQKVVKGKVAHPNRAGFIEESNKEPINRLTSEVHLYASQAYHGGYNGSSRIGWYDSMPTYDYDLIGAYTTAMALVPDINWSDPVMNEIHRENITLKHFQVPIVGEYPLLPMVGYFRFKFPDTVKFPSIPISMDGNLIYPLSSKGLDGVYACGPEVYIALKLGAEVYCDRGFVLNVKRNAEGGESRALAHSIRQLLIDRERAKDLCGKKSLEDLILKTCSNAVYGKIAQNVIQKQTWSTYCQEMETLGASAITNPFSACMITSIVRAELIAIMNEINDRGYNVYSVTTDGFITDMPEDNVQCLGMLGFKRFMEQSRLFLTDNMSNQIWECKHRQNHLLNLTTRGNMGLEAGGVSAHNSTRSPFDKTDPAYDRKDRLWFIDKCLSRKGPVEYKDTVWTKFKDLARGKDFSVVEVTKKVRMDFDMKRKPDDNTFSTVYPVVDEKQYEIANFDTIPFHTVNECRKYRSVKDRMDCLRTQDEWDIFFFKSKLSRNHKVRDAEWSKLFSCVMGHRLGHWVIDELNNPEWTVKDKCDWLNSLKLSPNKEFKLSDWKNARRPDRVTTMLPRVLLKETLEILGAKILQ